ncbi:hypothetical protein [uncultured Corynebacterium sp.]|uniref:hypothetical protein n=1 Tax=uncultured Corynebacterium sp. TaxID=159447 RepID=UPI0025FF55E8|nr:hypothetical protein [uncultured Corynebacterium sp.]
MADNTGYDDAGFDNDEQQERNDRSVRWSTVALSVGLSALASAVVIGVGAAVMFANASDHQITYVQGEGTANSSGVTSKKDANTTTAQRSTSGAKPTSTTSAGSGSSGEPARINGAAGAPIDDPSVGAGDSGNTGVAASARSSNAGVPAQPSNAELKNQMETILAQGASDETIAANLENPAGVQTIRDAGEAMRKIMIFRYEMVDPVVVEGDHMTATIQMSMVGLGSKPPADLYYVAKDGRWVLTDESVCAIASQARVACSV